MLSNSTVAKFHFNTAVNAEIVITFSTLSALGLMLLVIIACCYWKRQNLLCLRKSQCSTIIFIAVGIVSLLSIIFHQNETVYFALAMLLLWTSTMFILCGSFAFFTEPAYPIEKERHDSHLLPFILGISAIIIFQEVIW